MRIEIPQDLADTFSARFADTSVEEYALRAIREAIDEASPAAECWMASQSAVAKFDEED